MSVLAKKDRKLKEMIVTNKALYFKNQKNQF